MIRFVLQRLFFIVLVCIAIVFFVHLGMRMTRNSQASRPSYDLIDFSLDAWQDTRQYFQRIERGDLGLVQTSTGTYRLSEMISTAYSNSMGLLLVSLTGAAVLGVLIGGTAALSRRQRWVLPLLTITILGISTPSFVAGIFLQQGELLYLRTFGRQLVSMGGQAWDFKHLLLPALVLSARPLAYITRVSYLWLRQVLQEDYIRTAYAKGLSTLRVVNSHALQNMAVPVLTAVGVSLRFSLSTLPVVEFFFAWPGMGLRMLEGINDRQPALVASLALAFGLTMMLVNLLLDLLYRFIDPRLDVNKH